MPLPPCTSTKSNMYARFRVDERLNEVSESWLRIDHSSAYRAYNNMKIDKSSPTAYYYFGPRDADVINVTAIWLSVDEMCDPPAIVAGKVVFSEASGGGCVAITMYERMARAGARAFVPLNEWPASGLLVYTHYDIDRCAKCDWEMPMLAVSSRTPLPKLTPRTNHENAYQALHAALHEGEVHVSLHIENPGNGEYALFFDSWTWTINLRVVPGLVALVVAYLVVIQLRYERHRRQLVLSRHQRKRAEA
eukprot:CAMPEP_0119464412 /NCGR_PEP_ID=MMETSP1344-20130328/26_1 /TAXON_ID=236787 /ORGANISM="Florenciella parvula, Strain CCMP2471" /LENGTH=248 /DNA_ID=CAMNT_0007496621 /DNA_START=1 /DNA_END=744 /DNA_ORIENTATION=+